MCAESQSSRYLWVSLQLDSIFPDYSRRIVTYEQILNLIYNLPKDLPEAFEKALEGIIDDRYGNSIMKIVMAAQSPLSLDELRVALAVVPGDPAWYAAKLPTNASQLISLCGGNLLELDEEDGKVRFIHYSVVSHLQQTTRNPRTLLYHFTQEEAEIQSGAICVTYLHMPIFETGVTMTRKIDGEKLAAKVIGAATHQQPLLSHLAHHFKKRDGNQPIAPGFDIGRLVAEIQATSMIKFDPLCFQSYAVSNWFTHSRSFDKKNPVCMRVWNLWIRLLHGNKQVARLPFQSPVEESWPALSWALEHHHEALVYAIFEDPTTEPTDGERISQGILELALTPSIKMRDCSSLGLILVHLFQLAADILVACHETEANYGTVGHTSMSERKLHWNLLYQSLPKLLDLGADPTIPHSRNGDTIVQMLLATLGYMSESTVDGVQLCRLLTRALTCDNTHKLLQAAWVPHALRRILEHDNTQIFAKLLSYHPELHIGPEEDSLIGVAIAKGNIETARALVKAWPKSSPGPGQVSYINGQPAIQHALEIQNKEMVVLLARNGGLSHFHGRNEFSAPLLRTALEWMSVDWVELLLQLGAAPNLGYQANVDGAISRTEFRHHLQIAAERSQTLKFLILLRYGADPFLPGIHTISNIVIHHDNRVLMARLDEIRRFTPSSWRMYTGVQSHDRLKPSSAFLEACKMLALDVNEHQTVRHFGLSQSYDNGIQANGQEVELILLNLFKSTAPDRLNIECEEGNTALHYLTGGMDRFHREALTVASHLLASDWARPGLALRNKNGHTPLHRAIDNASRNNWRSPYIDSFLFHLSYDNYATKGVTGSGNSILVFAISKGAPVDGVIRVLLGAGSDPNGTLEGATPLETAVNMPWFRYASMVTDCLLSFHADASVKCSNGASLLDFVIPERRDWLRNLVQRPRLGRATIVPSTLERYYGVPEFTEDGRPIYELQDTSAARLLSLKEQRSHVPPRLEQQRPLACLSTRFWLHLSDYQDQMRLSTPQFSNISARDT